MIPGVPVARGDKVVVGNVDSVAVLGAVVGPAPKKVQLDNRRLKIIIARNILAVVTFFGSIPTCFR